uniref:Uncharacterized protein n=1 Tax=Ditylenchus dipsaci TaxID=166011 RepID=A0A915DK07_9BILA
MMDKNGKIASEDSLKEIPLLKNLLNHYQSLCESHDSEMLGMLEVLDKTRINWKTAMLDCSRLRATLESLERENINITTELRSTQEKLREGQAKNAALDSTNRDLAVEIEQYKRRFDTVKAILKACFCMTLITFMDKLMKLPFFTDKKSMPQPGGTPASSREPSLATTDDIDYDKTGDSFADALEEQVSEGGSSNARYGRANPRRSNRLKQQTNHRSSKTTKRRSASQQPLRPNGNKFSEVVITEEEENASDAPCPTPSKRRYEKAYVHPKTHPPANPMKGETLSPLGWVMRQEALLTSEALWLDSATAGQRAKKYLSVGTILFSQEACSVAPAMYV